MAKRNTLTLGNWLGIPIELDYSWFLIFVLLTWTLSAGYFPSRLPGAPTAEYWIAGAVAAVALFVSVLLHEMGHSLVAMAFHVPVRRITLFIFGGVSEIGEESPNAGAEFLISIVGPVVSFALAVLFYLMIPFAARFPFVSAIVGYLALVNFLLGVFNLIPGFPLDGGRVLRAIIWGATDNFRTATAIAGGVGQFFGFLLIIFGVWRVLERDLIGGLWIGFIGWFLESAAASHVRYQHITDMLAGHKVINAMSTDFVRIRRGDNLQDLIDHHILGSGRRSFMVVDDDHVEGLLTLHDVKKVPQQQWSTTSVGQVMTPADRIIATEPNAELRDAMREMDSDGVNQLPVMQDGRVLGMLTRENVVSFLRNLHDLQRR